LGLLVIFIVGCSNNSDDSKALQEFSNRIKSANYSMEVGSTVNVDLPGIKKGDLIIVINAGYAGYLNSDNQIASKNLEKNINEYGSRESAVTYLLLIRNEEIIADPSVSNMNLVTDNEPSISNNAKIATHENTKAVVTCVSRLGSRKNVSSAKLWNSECMMQLRSFE